MHLLSEVLSLDWLVVWYTIGPNILIILKQSQNKKGRKFDSAASKMVSFFKDIFVEGKKIIKYFVNDLWIQIWYNFKRLNEKRIIKY